jgi:transposase
MQLKTILNRVQRYGSFVFGAVRFVETAAEPWLEVTLKARANSRPRCSRCGRRGPGYDTLAPRRFEFVPLWGIKVYFLYAPRRVDCTHCGVHVEALPWAVGKHRLTTAYAWFLSRWARRLSWKEVAEVFRTSWDQVFRAVEMAVQWGCEHRDLGGIRAIGVDEVQWQRGHRYLTLVYQIDTHCKRLVWVGKERKVKTLLGFFRWLGPQRSAALKFVCSDMWKPYLRVIAKKAGGAIHVLDRFHIMAHLSKAIDEVRAQEGRAVSRALVQTHHALAHRTDEEGGAHAARPSAVDPELVPSQRRHLQRHRGGLQQQGQTEYQKSLRLSYFPWDGNRLASCTWRSTRATRYPQILLKRHKSSWLMRRSV